MHLVKNKVLIKNDTTHVADDASIPATGRITVSLQRWNDERDALSARADEVGVRIHGEDDVRANAESLLTRSLLALEFPKFADGRCYSHARILREELGYTGEMRAIGDILRDQVFFLNRVGFDALELRPDRDANAALAAFDDFTVTYQPAADEPNALFNRG